MANPWKITGSQIKLLWTQIWPKIVALAWLDDVAPIAGGSSKYRKCVENNLEFRMREVERIGDILVSNGLARCKWDSGIPISVATPDILGMKITQYTGGIVDHFGLHLEFGEEGAFRPNADKDFPEPIGNKYGFSCPDAIYGETFFYLNHKGLVLPWPPTPTELAVYVGYMEGGGLLPRVIVNGGPPWNLPSGTSLDPTESNLFDDLKNSTLSPCEKDGWQAYRGGISGIALMTLLEKWSKVVGGVWTFEDANRVRNNLQSFIMPEVWSTWPEFVKADHWEGHEFVMSSDSDLPGLQQDAIHMDVPVPAPTPVPYPDREAIFKELIVGAATNPMYSGCY